MEASPSQPSDQAPKAGSASPFLANLPSRGLFSSTVVSSNPGGMRVYLCQRDTAPPDDQEIKTNQLNILIRSLMIKKQKADSASKDGKAVAAAEGSRKRVAERVSDSRAKRANNQSCSRPEVSSSGRAAERRDFQGLTVERLRALLKERGLSPKGKKDELIARLKAVNG